MLATPEDTVLRRFAIAEDTVDFTLLKVEFVEDCTPLHPLVTVVRTADTEEVVRLLMLFHAVVMTVLMPFQLEVVSDFTAFHALVMEDFTAAVAEVTLDFTAEKLFWMLDLMLFQVLLVLVVMELHADFIAALTPAVPVRTVWLMAVQLWLYACSTPLMEFVMEVDSVVDKFSAAAVTRLVLALMPFAKPCMKSGIQLSMSARGPSSGTEKCRNDRILSATPVTAFATS